MSSPNPFETAVDYPISPLMSPDELTVGIESMSYASVIDLLSATSKTSAPLFGKQISQEPPIEITWRNLSARSNEMEAPGTNARLESLSFRAGRIAIGTTLPIPTSQEVKCGILATTGLNNAEIGSNIYLAENTVKTHLLRFFKKYGIVDRAAIARSMLANNFFRITTYCEELKLKPAEWEIVECTTLGMSNKEIGEQLGISPLTVKSHFARIAQSNQGIGSREQIALNALLSGQIDYRVNQN